MTTGDAAFEASRIAHHLMDDPGYTRRMAATDLARLAYKLDSGMAKLVLGSALHLVVK